MIDQMHEAYHKYVEENYDDPSYYILNNYTLNRLVCAIHSTDRFYYAQEYETETKFRDTPILIRHGDFNQEISIECV